MKKSTIIFAVGCALVWIAVIFILFFNKPAYSQQLICSERTKVLKDLKKMIAEEYKYWMAEQEPPMGMPPMPGGGAGDAPKVVDKAPSGRVYLDGSINVETDAQSIKDRKNLSINGYLEITLLVSNNGKIKKPIISEKDKQNPKFEDIF